MGKKLFMLQLVFAFILSFFLIGFVYGTPTYHGTLNVTKTGNQTSFGPVYCQANWTDFWTSCNNDVQTHACYDVNQCGGPAPAYCGETRSCSTTGGTGNGGSGGGSGGGGSSTTSSGGGSSGSFSCTENWQCGNWSNQIEACGVRNCTDLNSCGTTQFIPLENKICLSGENTSSSTNLTPGITGNLISPLGTGGSIVVLIILILFLIGIFYFKNKK